MTDKIKIPLQTMREAKEWADEIDQMDDPQFDMLLRKWTEHQVEDYAPCLGEYRDICLRAFERGGGKVYPIDIEVGLASYAYLDEHGFDAVDAANDDIWRYISTKVIPDLTYLRYPKPEQESLEQGRRINRKRFFSQTRRIWIKTLWWYVYLSWQGSPEETRAVIENNGADAINKFIETPGKGYRVDVYRQLMKCYSKLPGKRDKLFAAITKLNGAQCRNIEPALMPGGIDGYCDMLLNKALANEARDE